ncbi:MAG TPA: tRNA (adenosine(37)-N6)-threonylcarbamoyltransferase complex transferase subunit TsaD [Chthoniobacterales bacterium]
MGPLILAIETSCDETAVAMVDGNRLVASEVASQAELHQRFGGVVPEVASRNHLVKLRPLLARIFAVTGRTPAQLDAVAATRGPGLLTALLVGVAAAKGLAIGLDRPYLGINHLEGHLLSPYFDDPAGPVRSLGLVVSGGHTLLIVLEKVGCYRVVGRTVDDAAGEAFDKVAKLMGLPYPGGPVIDRLARNGHPHRYRLPRTMPGEGNLQFSFSGLKTAVRYLLPQLEGAYQADLAASFQEAVVDVLVRKTLAAARLHRCEVVTVSGGVSGNSRLRHRMTEACATEGVCLKLARPDLTTDNAAMIGLVAAQRLRGGLVDDLGGEADPNLRLDGDPQGPAT